MKLISLKLKNYRQFEDEFIEFATDPQRKVTFVEADNGAGKTTLMQSILWCLHAEINFEDKKLLNAKNEFGDVSVELMLEHSGTVYRFLREVSYRDLHVEPTSKLRIFYKEDSGIQREIYDESEAINTVRRILPRHLNKNFFFDGERLERMSQEIVGGQIEDFKDSVERLLGLSSLLNAMKHLKLGGGKKNLDQARSNSVIGLLDRQADKSASSKQLKLSDQISYYKEKLDEADDMLSDFKEKKYKSEIQHTRFIEELNSYSAVVKDINTLKDKKKDQTIYEKQRQNFQDDIAIEFRNKIYDFVVVDMVEKSKLIVENAADVDTGVPDIRDRTIKHLLEKGKCICGVDISDPNSEHRKYLIDLIKYIPPKSLGTLIDDFKRESSKINSQVDLADLIKSKCKEISEVDERLEEILTDITNIEGMLEDSSESNISMLQRKITDLRKDITTYDRNIGRFDSEKHGYLEQIKQLEKERDEMRSKVSRNKEALRKLTYANVLYEKISENYREKEKNVRDNLELLMNSYFSQIVQGVNLTINRNYQVDTDPKLEYSTGEKNSIIFSFIMAMLKLASDKQSELSKDDEVFPLVMDAPFSSLDETRKRVIGRLLLEGVDQIIIFDKDADDEKYFENHIGEIYRLLMRPGKMEAEIQRKEVF